MYYLGISKSIAQVTGYEGKILFDSSKPDGSPRKLMDSTLLNNLGWRPAFDLITGIKDTYAWYLDNN